MTIQHDTLRPGLLIALRTSIVGNVQYSKETIETEHEVEGVRRAKWETTRVVNDPTEHEAARKVRSRVGALFRGVCIQSAFGLLCPEDREPKLLAAITESRKLADEFNKTAQLTHVKVYVMTGRVAADDVEAVKAMNGEVRELLQTMEDGIKNLDVKSIREAAARVKGIGAMLSPEAEGRVRVAIETARDVAKQIVKSGEAAAQEIDTSAIKRITEMRTTFLDLDEVKKVKAPKARARAVDFEPEKKSASKKSRASARQVEV